MATFSKIIPVEEAVGMVLPHDVTEIRPGEFKGRAFKKGHVIRQEDVSHLKRLGKEHIYVLSLGPDDIHENEAAEMLAKALCGPGTAPAGEPVEGKINIIALYDGLLNISAETLEAFNQFGEVMCATRHDNTLIKKGETVAATRLIPLVAQRATVTAAAATVAAQGGIIRVTALRKAKVGLVITGNEVFSGKIKDAFEPVLRKKIADLGSEVIAVCFAPDNVQTIAGEIDSCLKQGADLIITSGGMSVDPDDVTRLGIKLAGATDIVYGSPVLPGAMFLVAYIGDIPIMGIPACGMFSRITVFDLLLPRVLAGEKIGCAQLARMGHGGLCLQCKECRYPICPFGK